MQPDLFPPAQRHSATSRAAAECIMPAAETLRRKVYEFIKMSGPYGATDLELQQCLKMAESTERPRRRELQLAGLIEESGKTRPTPSGRQSIVWRVK